MRTGNRTRLDNIICEDDEGEEKINDRSKSSRRLQIRTKTPTNAAKPGRGKAPKKDIPKNNSELNKENFMVYNVSYNFKIARILKHINFRIFSTKKKVLNNIFESTYSETYKFSNIFNIKKGLE